MIQGTCPLALPLWDGGGGAGRCRDLEQSVSDRCRDLVNDVGPLRDAAQVLALGVDHEGVGVAVPGEDAGVVQFPAQQIVASRLPGFPPGWQ